jgi:hypothetical protein
MILFEGYMGRILHTGDMRYSKEIFKETIFPKLKTKDDNYNIDELYLDNTFCD